MPASVLVFEPKYVGHFLGFAAAAARAFDRMGCSVVLAVPQEASGSTEAATKLADLSPSVEVRYIIKVPKRYDRSTNGPLEAEALSDLLSHESFDHVVVPSGDFLLTGLLTNGKARRQLKAIGSADMVLHNCEQAYPKIGIRNRAYRTVDQFAVELLRGVQLHTVDEFATSRDAIGKFGLFGRNPVKPLPHFVDRPSMHFDQQEARHALGLPGGAKLLGSVGDLGWRKGTELLIRSFVTSGVRPRCKLVLFGKLSPSARDTLDQHHGLVEDGSIIAADRFVSDEEFHQFFAAMDVIWAGFPRQIGMASTLLFAADARRPVIASDYGSVAWNVRRYGLGSLFSATAERAAEAIRNVVSVGVPPVDCDGIERFLKYHSTPNFDKHLTAGLTARVVNLRAKCQTGQAPTEPEVAVGGTVG